MRALILLALITTSIYGKSCKEYEKVSEYLNTQKFIKASRETRALKKEPKLNLGDINQARMLAYRFPAFEELGFGKPGSRGWTKYTGNLEKSLLFGKQTGWEIKNDKGHARVRLDWHPEQGAHYNIEITEKKNGSKETHKLAINFQCADKKCTEDQVRKMAERMQ
jgi:hypothetical protein